jgi:hypothetical protein
VIQSAREITRLAGLIHKITNSKTKPAPSPRSGLPGAKTAKPFALNKTTSPWPEQTGKDQPAAGQNGKTDINPNDLIMPDLETLFTPNDMAYWDGLPDNAYKKFRENYRELQSIGKEMAADLLASTQEGAAAE